MGSRVYLDFIPGNQFMKEVRHRPGPFNEPINMASQEGPASFSKQINEGHNSSFHLVMRMKLSFSKQIQLTLRQPYMLRKAFQKNKVQKVNRWFTLQNPPAPLPKVNRY